VLLDLMVNHLSRQSDEFRTSAAWPAIPHADLFITVDKVWPDGQPPAADVARIFLRKPDAPFSTITIGDTGARETVWTSFGTKDWSEQVDLDLRSPVARRLVAGWLGSFAAQGSASCAWTPSATWSRSPARAASWWSRRSGRSSTGWSASPTAWAGGAPGDPRPVHDA